jgi:uncharacterized protein
MPPTISQLIHRRHFLLSSIALTACTRKKVSLELTEAMTSAEDILTFSFTSIPPKNDSYHHHAPELESQILLYWGMHLFEEEERSKIPQPMTATEQKRRFGYNNDYIAFDHFNDTTLLIINHESTIAGHMFDNEEGYTSNSLEHIKVEMEAHGLSIVEIRRENKQWKPIIGSPYNRRITAHTETKLSGMAAGHPRLQTHYDPTGTKVFGTLHNCSGGQTPWGTILTCEENILYYFRGDPEKETTQQKRSREAYYIGHSKAYHWNEVEDRFDLSKEPNEPNRFGWVVEIDPRDPNSIPIKRTSLGRIFHESANPILNYDGRVIIYMGDDGRNEFLYRFVSSERYDDKNPNLDILDSGTLSVAKFYEDGHLEWLPIVYGQGPLTEENGFLSQVDCLIDLRIVSRLLEATPMDRTEDVEPQDTTGKVFVNCTNNSTRGKEGKPPTNPANPRTDNIFGHTIEIQSPKVPKGFDHSASTMTWEILLLAGKPNQEEVHVQYGNLKNDTVSDNYFGCPDNACIDPDGRLWISTDGSEGTVGFSDGLYGITTEGEKRGTAHRIFLSPKGAEVTGPCFSPDGRSLFVAVQHPDCDWPFVGDIPRPSIVVLQRRDYKKI